MLTSFRLLAAAVRRNGTRRRDAGSVSIIIMGFAAIVVLLLAVVVGASRVYLTQRDLAGSADAAAASAAQAVSEAAIFSDVPQSDLPLDEAGAMARVRDYVIAADLAARYDGFAVTAVTVDGAAVTVTLTATSPVPFGGMLSSDWADGYPVVASATARSPFTF